jgi:hypothetical protein
MNALSNREVATLIWTGTLAIALVVWVIRDSKIRSSFASVARAFLAWKIQLVLATYLLYAAGAVLLAYRLGLWEPDLLKDTLIVTLGVGLPLAMNAYTVRDGKSLVSDVARKTIGIAALLAFYLGVESLPLWCELVLQPVLVFLVLLGLVAQRKAETRSVASFTNALVLVITLALLAYTTVKIVQNWAGYDRVDQFAEFAVSVWLPLALLPFIYVLAFVMHCESIFVRLPYYNQKKTPQLRVRFALLLGLHFSARLASSFTGKAPAEIARAKGFRVALRIMRSFRQSLRDEAATELARVARLEEFSGVEGIDELGLQLDRREFAATKTVLTHLYFMQMGWHRRQLGHYKSDMLNILGNVTKDGLPEDHGIELLVSKDKQSWRAWRRTVGGWYFGVGGTHELLEQWQFSGSSAPGEFPADKRPGWINATLAESWPEWTASDH